MRNKNKLKTFAFECRWNENEWWCGAQEPKLSIYNFYNTINRFTL